MIMRTLPALVTALGLTACSLAPDYTPSPIPPPVSYKETDGWKQAAPADTWDKGKWWQAFGNAELNSLQDRVNLSNQSLKAATARLEQAQALTRNARADLFPQVSGGTSFSRLRRSDTMQPATHPLLTGDDKLSVGISYEVDVWGRIHNAIEAAQDDAQASAADLAVLELSIRSDLTTNYFALRGADTSLRILTDTILADQAALDLIERRHAGGIAIESDWDQAKAQLETAKTQASDVRLKRAQLEHAIAILMGEPPAQFQLPPAELSGEPPGFPIDQPSTLLERRPDIAAAERRVAAANAAIGVARAAWYPVFDLGALVGLETANPANLLRASSAIWALGPGSLSQIIFDGGKRDAVTDQAKSAFNEAAANYRQTTLTAWREVEDQLAALNHLEQESQSQAKAVKAQAQAVTQAKFRYQGGIATYLEVVVNQNALLTAQLSEADIHLRRLTADVLLIKSLGGGWAGIDHDSSTP